MNLYYRIKQRNEELERQYEEAQEEARADFEEYAEQYLEGELDSDEFQEKLKERLQEYYLLLAMLASGGSFGESGRDVQDLEAMVEDTFGLVDSLMETLADSIGLSDRYVIWRAGIFAMARPGFVRFLLPGELWDALPEHPGISCLGDGACQCSLEWETLENGDVAVYWLLGPSEHCAVCLSLAVDWQPYIVSAEDLFL